MKLLFICESIDLALKHKLDELSNENIQADALVLPKFTIYRNWEKEVINPSSIFDSLDKISKLSYFAKKFKYKKLFEMIGKYDSINIYKCVNLLSDYLNEIKKNAHSYYVTVDNLDINKNKATMKMFEGANCILFEEMDKLTAFEKLFGFDEKTLIARNGNHILSIIDSLKDEEIDKFTKYFNLSSEKNLVYCDLGSQSKTQLDFISDVLKLPYSLLKRTTFIFDPTSSTLVDKENLVEFLADKQFDFLVPDSLLTDRQKAILLKISQSSIILPSSDDYNTLQPSLYTKSHVYLYRDYNKQDFYKKHEIYVDNFDNFENIIRANSDTNQLANELLEKNKIIVKKLFHPSVTHAKYMEILKVL